MCIDADLGKAWFVLICLFILQASYCDSYQSAINVYINVFNQKIKFVEMTLIHCSKESTQRDVSVWACTINNRFQNMQLFHPRRKCDHTGSMQLRLLPCCVIFWMNYSVPVCCCCAGTLGCPILLSEGQYPADLGSSTLAWKFLASLKTIILTVVFN